MWSLTIPQKVIMFSWLLIKEKLQTRKRLGRYIKELDNKHAFVGMPEDDQNHIFINCNYTTEV